MKKLLSIILVTFFVVGLAGCDFGTDEVPDDIVDIICGTDQTLVDGVCVDDEVDPTCGTDQTLVDGVCVDNDTDPTCDTDQTLVDGVCVDNDTDPTCDTDQTLVDGVCVDNNTDPTCGTDQTLIDGVCVDNNTDPTCDSDQTLIDGVCVDNPPVDTRTPEEILADAIIESWDGELTHLEAMMDNMSFDTSMEFITEFNIEMDETTDTGLESHFINVIIADNYQYLSTGTVMHRNITVNFDGEIHYIEFMFEEVATGVVVYMNIADIKVMLETEGPEALDYLDTLGATEDWLMFRFDDTLANVIELEVMKEMIVDIFFLQMGDTFFYDLQDELDTELDLLVPLLSTYGINIGLFVDHLIDEDLNAAELLLEAIDYETLIFDLDAVYLVPELSAGLTENKTELDLATFDTDAQILYLEAFGTEAWLLNLTDGEIVILIDVLVDDPNTDPNAPDFSDMYDAYLIDDLDHFIVMFVLDNPDVALELGNIPGFDFAVYYAAMDALDYDAFYLETVDMELLADAVYAGQDAYDIFVLALNMTAPETASILEAFSGVVLELEQYMLYIDDMNYVFDNLYIFEDYIDLQYYLDNDIVTVSIDPTEDFEIETTVVFDGSKTSKLFIDILPDIYWFLDDMESFEMPFIEHVNCPTGETCESFADYIFIIADLTQLGYAEMVTVYDPSNPGEFTTVIDFSDFVTSLVALDEGDAVFNDFSVKFTVRETGTVTLPTLTVDVNEIAQDFAKVSLNFMTYDYVRDALEYYTDNPLDFSLGDHSLDSYGDYMYPSLAFDANMSFITLGGSVLAPTISCTLYWADGTLVFTEPISLQYLDGIMDTGVPTAAEYQMLLSKVEEANWNMSKMIMVFLFSDFDNKEEMEYIEDPYNKEWLYYDALEVENAGHTYCAYTNCINGTQLSWALLSPYFINIDTNNYDLANNGGVVATVVNGFITVDLERNGTGDWEFTEGLIPSQTFTDDVIIDTD